MPKDTIKERFERFHAAHPEVYTELTELTRQAVRAGRRRVGMKQVFEVVRWHRFVRPDKAEDFRLNNIYTAHYARLIMRQEPDLFGVFDTRKLRSP